MRSHLSRAEAFQQPPVDPQPIPKEALLTALKHAVPVHGAQVKAFIASRGGAYRIKPLVKTALAVIQIWAKNPGGRRFNALARALAILACVGKDGVTFLGVVWKMH